MNLIDEPQESDDEFSQGGATEYTVEGFYQDLFGSAMPVSIALRLLKFGHNVPGINFSDLLTNLYNTYLCWDYSDEPYVFFNKNIDGEIEFKIEDKEVFYPKEDALEENEYLPANFLDDIYYEPMPVAEALKLLAVGHGITGNNVTNLISYLQMYLDTKKYGDDPFVLFTSEENGDINFKVGYEEEFSNEFPNEAKEYTDTEYLIDLIEGSYTLGDAINVLTAGTLLTKFDKKLKTQVHSSLRKLLTFIEFIEDDTDYEVSFEMDENLELIFKVINIAEC